MRNKVYAAISHGLSDLSFLNGFTNSVVSAELVSEGHASLVENSNEYQEKLDGSDSSYRSGVTTTVAVAAASVTILVASIFCYGFVRRPNSQDPSVRHRNRSLRKINPRTVVSGSQLGVPMRRHFVRLEDLSASPTSFVTASISPHSYPNAYSEEVVPKYSPDYPDQEYYHEVNYNPTINWSVSDITSDSASLRSGVSRTPSMLERIDEEIEDEEEDIITENKDGNSCNFSYSEDSTIITKALSIGSTTGLDHCNDNYDYHCRNPTYQNFAESDCVNERQDQIMDISDLDPCFTILPDNPEDVFRDIEDLSSEGTQESLLESIVLEMRLSTDGCDDDTLDKTLSDTSITSLLSREDLVDLKTPMKQDYYKTSIDCIDGKIPKGDSLEAIPYTFDNNVVRSRVDSQSGNQDNSVSLDSTTKKNTNCLTELYLKAKPVNEILPTSSGRKDSYLVTTTENITTATKSRKAIPVSEVESEMYDSGTSPPVPTSRSCVEQNYRSLCLEDHKSFDIKAKIENVPHDMTEIDSISIYSDEGDETTDSSCSDIRIDDDCSTNLQSVDSIDEWASELMNEKGVLEPTIPNA